MLHKNLRTDMALDLDVTHEQTDEGICRRSCVKLSPRLARKLGKAPGHYITIESDAALRGDRADFDVVATALAQALSQLGELADCLVVGLGNPHLTADALGNLVMRRLMVTRHIPECQRQGMGAMSAICPNVLGMTGIESCDIIRGVIARTKPRCVISVDSLASATIGRIGSAFQVSDAGITPGSGVGNHRLTLSRRTIGIPVYSIGVPLVVFASTIVGQVVPDDPSATQRIQEIGDMIVTPKDIDWLVEQCATIIARAINMAVHGTESAGLLEDFWGQCAYK